MQRQEIAMTTRPGFEALDHQDTNIVWTISRRVGAQLAPIPASIERDNDMPGFLVLAGEAEHARAVMSAQQAGTIRRATWARRGTRRKSEETMSDPARVQAVFAQSMPDTNAAGHVYLRNADQQIEYRVSIQHNGFIGGEVSALRTRFPVVDQLVGTEFFRAMAAAYLTNAPPCSPVDLHFGDAFPAFIDAFAPAAPIPYLGDVARIELARGLAYHAADVAPLEAAALAALRSDRPGDMRVRLHPSVSVVVSRHPAFSIWRVNQNPDRVVPVTPWGPEAVSSRRLRTARPWRRRLPPGPGLAPGLMQAKPSIC
jgi:hypothetical protein